MADQLIPVVIPPTLGRGDRNGDRCRWQAPSALEAACQHLGLYRRRVQAGFCGKVVLSAAATWRFNLEQEPYTQQMVCVLLYSTSSPNVTAVFSIATPVDPGVTVLFGTEGAGADQAARVAIAVQAGAGDTADAQRQLFTAAVSIIASSDADELAPTVTVWSVKWRTDRIPTADITA